MKKTLPVTSMKHHASMLRERLNELLESWSPAIERLSSRAKLFLGRARSRLSRRLSTSKRRYRLARARLATLAARGREAGRALVPAVRETRTAVAEFYGPRAKRIKRFIHRQYTKLPFYPVDVAERPVPTQEDPTISEKVAQMRVWMREQGIGDHPVEETMHPTKSRMPPKAAASAQPGTSTSKRAKRKSRRAKS